MAAIVKDGIAAGALGFSSSRTLSTAPSTANAFPARSPRRTR
jgi:N-acyl-D-aspartate/D-glutamate deacylase